MLRNQILKKNKIIIDLNRKTTILSYAFLGQTICSDCDDFSIIAQNANLTRNSTVDLSILKRVREYRRERFVPKRYCVRLERS